MEGGRFAQSGGETARVCGRSGTCECGLCRDATSPGEYLEGASEMGRESRWGYAMGGGSKVSDGPCGVGVWSEGWGVKGVGCVMGGLWHQGWGICGVRPGVRGVNNEGIWG